MPRTTKRQQQLAQQPTEIHDDPMSWLRSYQIPLVRAFFIEKKDRFWVGWHRKTGKDYTLAKLAKMYMLDAYGNHGLSPLVIHALPTFKTAKEVIWDGPCGKGRFVDEAFPPAIREEFSETECMIRLKDGYGTKTGPVYQLQGAAEAMQRRRGPNASGVILSEYQDMPETVFEEIYEPMVVSNHGWAAFAGTHRGKNHHYRLGLYAERQARQAKNRWFHSFLTCETTRKDAPGEDGTPVTTPEEIAEMRRRGVDEAIILQEHYNSPLGVQRGSILGDCVQRAEREGRIVRVPREVNAPVGCCLDIGRSDGTAIWFYQTLARETRLIDYCAFKANHIGAMSAAEYAIKLIKERPYIVTRIVLPHDAKAKGYSATLSTQEVFESAFPSVVLLDKLAVQQGIDMLRSCFPRIVFDVDKCGMPQADNLPAGLESLRGYHRAWSNQAEDWTGEPVHDENSHGADALRYGAQEGFTPLDFLTHMEVDAADRMARMSYNPLVSLRDPRQERGRYARMGGR